MHPAIQTLKNALARATFIDDELHDATMKLVDDLGFDLEADDYEVGSTVEESEKYLTEVLDALDAASEDTDEAIKNADASEDTDEIE